MTCASVVQGPNRRGRSRGSPRASVATSANAARDRPSACAGRPLVRSARPLALIVHGAPHAGSVTPTPALPPPPGRATFDVDPVAGRRQDPRSTISPRRLEHEVAAADELTKDRRRRNAVSVDRHEPIDQLSQAIARDVGRVVLRDLQQVALRSCASGARQQETRHRSSYRTSAFWPRFHRGLQRCLCTPCARNAGVARVIITLPSGADGDPRLPPVIAPARHRR